jgi:hypothetical protein
MRGIYVFRSGATELYRSENLITTAGKQIIANYLSQNGPPWCGAIAIGSGTTAASTANTRLEFEYYRATMGARAVNFGGGAGGTHRLILKATLPELLVGSVREVGIFPGMTNLAAGLGQSTLVSNATSPEGWQYYNGSAWDVINTTPNTTFNRVGKDCITMPATATPTRYRLPASGLDFSQYSANDVFTFTTIWDTNKPTSIEIRFVSDSSNYYAYNVPVTDILHTTTSTYRVASIAKSLWVATGAPSWSMITSIEVIAGRTSGASNLYLDGIRIDDTDTINSDYSLVSRSVLTTPITKLTGSEMDIEYYVDV